MADKRFARSFLGLGPSWFTVVAVEYQKQLCMVQYIVTGNIVTCHVKQIWTFAVLCCGMRQRLLHSLYHSLVLCLCVPRHMLVSNEVSRALWRLQQEQTGTAQYLV